MPFTWHKSINITFLIKLFISYTPKKPRMISWRKKVIFWTYYLRKCYCTFLTQCIKHKPIYIPNIVTAFNTIPAHTIFKIYFFRHNLNVTQPLQTCSNIWRHKFLHNIMRRHFYLLLVAHYIRFELMITFN